MSQQELSFVVGVGGVQASGSGNGLSPELHPQPGYSCPKRVLGSPV